jgi:hypothetical protein
MHKTVDDNNYNQLNEFKGAAGWWNSLSFFIVFVFKYKNYYNRQMFLPSEKKQSFLVCGDVDVLHFTGKNEGEYKESKKKMSMKF